LAGLLATDHLTCRERDGDGQARSTDAAPHS
jgi:hypothetical protein